MAAGRVNVVRRRPEHEGVAVSSPNAVLVWSECRPRPSQYGLVRELAPPSVYASRGMIALSVGERLTNPASG